MTDPTGDAIKAAGWNGGAWKTDDGKFIYSDDGRNIELIATVRRESDGRLIVKAVNNHARLEADNARLREALTLVRGIIVEAALTGFNCHDGDWAERLFASQGDTHAALAQEAAGCGVWSVTVTVTVVGPAGDGVKESDGGVFKCNCPHEVRSGCSEPKCPHFYERPTPSEPTPDVVAEPVAWLFTYTDGSTDVTTMVERRDWAVAHLPNIKITPLAPVSSSPPAVVTLPDGFVLAEFKPGYIVNEAMNLIEVLWEDVGCMSQPLIPGVYHWIDRKVAFDDGRDVGLTFWAYRPPQSDPAPTFRDGVDAAAKWHDQRAFDIGNLLAQELDDKTRQHVLLARGRHLQHAISIRALTPPVAAGSERDDGR